MSVINKRCVVSIVQTCNLLRLMWKGGLVEIVGKVGVGGVRAGVMVSLKRNLGSKKKERERFLL